MMRQSSWIGLGVLLALFSGACAQDSGRSETESRTMAVVSNPQERLTAYLTTSAKYQAVPIPTGLPEDEVLKFVQDQTLPTTSAVRLTKLVRLARLYDLKPAATVFAGLLRLPEQEPRDFVRSSLAISGTVALGDAAAVQLAQRNYQTMLSRAFDDSLRTAFADAGFALGTQDAVKALEQWATTRRAALAQQMSAAQSAGQHGQVATLRQQEAELEEFVNLRLKALREAAALRAKLEKQDAKTRSVSLVQLYLGKHEDATPDLEEWAGFELARLRGGDAAARDAAVAELRSIAQKHAAPRPDVREEHDLLRAKALRAVEFLGVPLQQDERDFLETVEDTGANLLAVRDDWVYRTH